MTGHPYNNGRIYDRLPHGLVDRAAAAIEAGDFTRAAFDLGVAAVWCLDMLEQDVAAIRAVLERGDE